MVHQPGQFLPAGACQRFADPLCAFPFVNRTIFILRNAFERASCGLDPNSNPDWKRNRPQVTKTAERTVSNFESKGAERAEDSLWISFILKSDKII